jgi:ABC-2 type transport system permease protein
MSDLTLALRQVRYTNKTFWRNPTSAFFTFAFPLMFLVIFSVLLGNGDTRIPGLGFSIKQSTFYTPAIIAFSVITACYTNIAMSVTFARDNGVLKRTRGTPMPTWSYLTARIIHATVIAILLTIICAAFGRVFYGVRLPSSTLPAFVVALILGAFTFCALGLAVTSIVPNADAAPAVVNATILPLLFISDVFIPLGDHPAAWISHLSNFFPVRHFSHAMLTTFLTPSGSAFGAIKGDLTNIAIWGAVGLLFAVRRFSWEPRR